MRPPPLLWLVLLGLSSGGAQAQSLTSPNTSPWARLESSDWVAVGAVAGATAGSFLIEEKVRAAFQQNRSEFADALERVGWWYGTPLFTVPATLLTLGAGELLDDADVTDTGVLMTQVLLSALSHSITLSERLEDAQ